MKKWIIVDIDHVLSDAAWRDNLIGGELGWDHYHSQSVDDEPLADMVQLVQSFHAAGLRTLGITARPEKWRQQTMEWLLKHNILLDEILMRPEDNYMKSGELKVYLAQSFSVRINLKLTFQI